MNVLTMLEQLVSNPGVIIAIITAVVGAITTWALTKYRLEQVEQSVKDQHDEFEQRFKDIEDQINKSDTKLDAQSVYIRAEFEKNNNLVSQVLQRLVAVETKNDILLEQLRKKK